MKRRYVRQPVQSVWKSMAQALFNGNDFDFAECACGKILDGEAASCRFAREVFCIDFVKGGKVFHVCEEAGRFTTLSIEVSAFLKWLLYFADLFRLSGNVGDDDFSCGRVDTDLSGKKYKSARLLCL